MFKTFVIFLVGGIVAVCIANFIYLILKQKASSPNKTYDDIARFKTWRKTEQYCFILSFVFFAISTLFPVLGIVGLMLFIIPGMVLGRTILDSCPRCKRSFERDHNDIYCGLDEDGSFPIFQKNIWCPYCHVKLD